VNSLSLFQRLMSALEDEIPPKLKGRMSGDVFALAVLAANAALAVRAVTIVKLLSS
jgi:hypothetical protein